LDSFSFLFYLFGSAVVGNKKNNLSISLSQRSFGGKSTDGKKKNNILFSTPSNNLKKKKKQKQKNTTRPR